MIRKFNEPVNEGRNVLANSIQYEFTSEKQNELLVFRAKNESSLGFRKGKRDLVVKRPTIK